jgi:phage terminase small subunit
MVQPKGNTDSNLSDKQEMFCKEYLIDLNGNKAAIRAGYSPDSARVQASVLLTNPNILARIRALMDERSKNLMIDATFVIEGLKDVYNKCMQPTPVLAFDAAEKKLKQKVDEDGNFVFEFDSTGANKALELLGKHLALFTEKTENKHSGSVGININFTESDGCEPIKENSHS